MQSMILLKVSSPGCPLNLCNSYVKVSSSLCITDICCTAATTQAMMFNCCIAAADCTYQAHAWCLAMQLSKFPVVRHCDVIPSAAFKPNQAFRMSLSPSCCLCLSNCRQLSLHHTRALGTKGHFNPAWQSPYTVT